MIIFLLSKEWVWRRCNVYILVDMGCIYIYIYVKLCASIRDGRFIADPLNGSYFGVNYSIFLWARRK